MISRVLKCSEADIPLIHPTKIIDMQNIKLDWVKFYHGLYNLNICSGLYKNYKNAKLFVWCGHFFLSVYKWISPKYKRKYALGPHSIGSYFSLDSPISPAEFYICQAFQKSPILATVDAICPYGCIIDGVTVIQM